MSGIAIRMVSWAGLAVLVAIAATGCGGTTATTSASVNTAPPVTTGVSTTVAPSSTAPAVTVSPSTTMSPSPASTDAAGTEGATLFADNCAACHGAQGEGGAGPDLRPLAPGDASLAAAIVDTINSGGGGMPVFSGRFDNVQMSALVAYVLGL